MIPLVDRVRKSIVQALSDFSMIEPQDRVLVAVSGGKDSTILILLLDAIRKISPIPFELAAVIVDQKQPNFDATVYQAWLRERGIDLKIIEEDTYSIVVDKTKAGKSFCGLCSRLRRGILYNYAHEHGYTKLALGHHRDDLNETLLLNMFYSGKLASMPPKLWSDDGRNVVIRPLCYVEEAQLVELALDLQIPVIPCNLCGSQENMQRKKMKQLLRELAKENPTVQNSLSQAQANVRPSQLSDSKLHSFKASNSRFLVIVECVLEKDGKFLIIRRPQGGHAGGLLALPGGKAEDTVDGGEGQDILRNTAMREVQEEVGVTLQDPVRFVTSSYFTDTVNGQAVLSTTFHCRLVKTDAKIIASPREVPEYFWLSADEINNHPDTPIWLKRQIQSCS